VVTVWSTVFVQRRHGGLGLILLSVALLLFGSGFGPPLISIIGGAVGTQINRPLGREPGRITGLAARLWSHSYPDGEFSRARRSQNMTRNVIVTLHPTATSPASGYRG
jgi:hypothetical protein